ncbi:hypothetical protein FDF74_11695 [Clostridium niameyense]|uniref:Ribbon-helix-helix protein, CopG family n=1 Tax=Clostridium niameyense TaxID=1622073 RepID=A0A6M0RC84_9CLOT|nr:hypothetical protein [Clostridium niameyense]NEZ47844.1 hypothetical protein [Clostridium niameyense]
MKKSVSFNLEEDIIKKIEEYQKENNLSSRSAALERIVLKLDNKDILRVVEELLNKKKTESNEHTEEKIEEEKTIIDNSITDMFNNMPD